MNCLSPVDDQVWSAIGDPTRRRLLDRLLEGGAASASAIGREMPVSRQAVAKHLVVLEAVGLVTSDRIGREVVYGIDEEHFARAVAQVAAVGSAWSRRLDRIRLLAEQLQAESAVQQRIEDERQ